MPIRVLVAEDDHPSLILLRIILKGTGEFEVVTATDGEKAWKLLDAGPRFDLCIFDIMMPELDGLQLAGRLRGDPRFHDQKIMLCTAVHDRSTVEQAAALAIRHFVVKPYAREQVLTKVRALCGEPRAAIPA